MKKCKVKDLRLCSCSSTGQQGTGYFLLPQELKHKKPNSYAIITGTSQWGIPWNFGTFWNLHLEPLYPRNLLEPLRNTFTWRFGAFRNLAFPSPAPFTWNPYLEPQNLPEPSLGTLSCLQLSYKTFYLESWNLLDPLLATLTWNLRTLKNITWSPWLEPWNLPQPLRGALPPPPGNSEPSRTFAWNPWSLATFRNLGLEPLSFDLAEPCGMTAPECPRA